MSTTDFINIEKTSPKEKILEDLKKVQQEYTGKHEPFDFRNALLAIEDYERQWTREVQTALSNRTTPPTFKTTWDWKEYGNNDRFEKVASNEVRDVNPKLGMVTPTLTGYNVDYRVKGKGNGISVFVPIDKWNERNKK